MTDETNKVTRHQAWTQLELYIEEHTEADFSHGICEPCAKKMYPEIYEKLRLSGDKKE